MLKKVFPKMAESKTVNSGKKQQRKLEISFAKIAS